MDALVINLVFWLLLPVVLALLGYASQFLLSLPLRRRERARLFLDLVEIGLRDGRSPEQTVRMAAESGDGRLGVRFHLLAAHLESGLSLDQAFARVPRLLPAGIVGMLRAGRESGDVGRVLPACRQLLRDPVAAVWSAHNYMMLAALVFTPAWIFMFTVIMVFVVPKFVQIAIDMEAPFPGLMQVLTAHHELLIGLQALLALGFYGAVLCYLGGPRLAGWINRIVPGLTDRAAWQVPWRHKRLLRDFSSILAMLLDAGMPEARALVLAGESTANAVLRKRAQAAADELARGATLTDAVRRLDDTGEFRWRLDNATHGAERFLAALDGWHEALSAKAFQLEQAAAQTFTAGLVVVNGVFVALLAVGVFSLLVGLIQGGVLW